MGSAEKAKKRLLRITNPDESFEAIAAERTNSRCPDYWQKACMEVSRKLERANESNKLAGVQVRILKEQKAGLEGEVNSLRVELNSMRAQRNRANKEAFGLRKKLTALEASGAENARLAELFRDHLDDSAEDQQHDNEWEYEARQMTWSDIDAAYQAEGIDE